MICNLFLPSSPSYVVVNRVHTSVTTIALLSSSKAVVSNTTFFTLWTAILSSKSTCCTIIMKIINFCIIPNFEILNIISNFENFKVIYNFPKTFHLLPFPFFHYFPSFYSWHLIRFRNIPGVHGEHAVAPWEFEYSPAGHNEQEDALIEEKEPGEHSVQLVEPFCEEYDPIKREVSLWESVCVGLSCIKCPHTSTKNGLRPCLLS